MSKYKGTQTKKNLAAAFAVESQARNKYTYFAFKAKKEGFEQISALFLKTADNEKEHAKMWFKELEGIGSAADGENFEWTVDRHVRWLCQDRGGRRLPRAGGEIPYGGCHREAP